MQPWHLGFRSIGMCSVITNVAVDGLLRLATAGFRATLSW